jgi:threonine/homoserine/homoserine lactone efflux protein
LIKFFFLGIISALPFTISFGPVFFAISETSLKRGFISGVIVSFGILLSDILFVTLIGLGFAAFFGDEISNLIFSLFGGIMLLFLGISFFKKEIKLHPKDKIKISKRPVESFLKGFIINSLNPYVVLFWTGMVALVNTNLEIKGGEFRSYFSGFLLILFASDLFKAWLAKSLRDKLNQKLKIIYRVIGVIFLLFGIKLVYEFLLYLWS